MDNNLKIGDFVTSEKTNNRQVYQIVNITDTDYIVRKLHRFYNTNSNDYHYVKNNFNSARKFVIHYKKDSQINTKYIKINNVYRHKKSNSIEYEPTCNISFDLIN